ncbi:12420_t:CDS:1, partial [Cetraspora pellucida]
MDDSGISLNTSFLKIESSKENSDNSLLIIVDDENFNGDDYGK